MKKLATLLFLSALISFTSCGDKKEDKKSEKVTIQSKKETTKKVDINFDDKELIAKGKVLFKDRTCFTCHLPTETAIGPSIVDINKIYADNNADIVDFLKDEIDPIVDKDPGQVAVMKANIDSFVKDLKDEELNALKAYMLSVN